MNAAFRDQLCLSGVPHLIVSQYGEFVQAGIGRNYRPSGTHNGTRAGVRSRAWTAPFYQAKIGLISGDPRLYVVDYWLKLVCMKPAASGCQDKILLLNTYQEAAAAYSEELTRLRADMGTLSREDYENAYRHCELMRMDARMAQERLDLHVENHGC